MEALNLFGIILAATAGFIIGMMSIYLVGLYSDLTFDKRMEEKMKENRTASGERPCGTCPHYIDFKISETDSVMTCELFKCIHKEEQEKNR